MSDDASTVNAIYEFDPTQGVLLEDLQRDVSVFLTEGLSDPDVREDAEAAGIDLDAVAEASPEITVERADAELTGIEEAIIIHLVFKAGDALVSRVIVPWIRRRRGEKVVGERRKDVG